MSVSLIQQIERVRWRLQRRRALTASCWALVAAIAVAVVLASFDRWLGIEDVVGRTVCTAAMVVVYVVIARRWVQAVWEHPIQSLEVAGQVEQLHPPLRDLISSAIDFSQQSDEDSAQGSVALRRAVVLEATAGAEQIDWSQLIPRRPLRRATIATATVGLLLSLLVWWMPHAVGVGALRLFNPLGSAEWPREHDLQFIDPPTILAAGDELRLAIHDTHGRLPSPVRMHYRIRKEGHWEEEIATLPTNGSRLEVRRANVQSPLEYRATGGDHHTMPWQELQVVQPPRIVSIEMTITPPEYTQREVRTETSNHVQVFVGSEVAISGTMDQSVVSAALVGKSDWRLPLEIAADGVLFSTKSTIWKAEQSEHVAFEFTTPSGLATQSSRRLLFNVVADALPKVEMIQPISDVQVIPTANLDMTIAASDDLALSEIQLVYRRSDRSPPESQTLSLWRGRQKSQTVDYRWQLNKLKLAPGNVVEAHVQASDHRPKRGRSDRSLRVVVISLEQMLQSLRRRQQQLASAMDELQMQQREQRQVTADWIQQKESWSERWVAEGHASLYAQRRMAAVLGEGTNSISARVDRLLVDLERNQIDRPATKLRLEQTRSILRQLAKNSVPKIDELLTELIRRSLLEGSTWAKREALVREIAEQQDELLLQLSRLSELFRAGDLLGRTEHDLVEILNDQRRLTQHCEQKIAPGLLQTLDTSSYRQAHDLVSVATARQRQLARRVVELLLRLSQSAGSWNDRPMEIARTRAASIMARELEIPTTMQTAAEQLALSRLARAATFQRRAIVDLERLLQQLRDPATALRVLERLGEAEQALRNIRQRVDRLHQQQVSGESSANEDSGRLRQQQLVQELDQWARQLDELQVESAAQATRSASAELHRNPLDASQTERAGEHLDKAIRQLIAARLKDLRSESRGGAHVSQDPEPSSNNASGTSSTASQSSETSADKSTTPEKVAEGLVMDVWGHLPTRERDKILQPLREEFLPQYAPEIEAYFRALANPDQEKAVQP